MNEKIINGIKNYVNMMMAPLEYHYYHQYAHALEVANRAVELGKKEGVTESELECLFIAGLFHDIGFIIQYDNNEIIGATLAKNYLQSIIYPYEKIELIEKLIIATTVNIKPKNLLEEIIKDADTDNLGRDDFFEKGERLKKELESIKKIKFLEPDWTHNSIKFLINHNFNTKTEIIERQGKKDENLKNLKKKLNIK